MSAVPKIVTADRDPASGIIAIRGDGVALVLLKKRQALWLIARLAEALAAKP